MLDTSNILLMGIILSLLAFLYQNPERIKKRNVKKRLQSFSGEHKSVVTYQDQTIFDRVINAELDLFQLIGISPTRIELGYYYGFVLLIAGMLAFLMHAWFIAPIAMLMGYFAPRIIINTMIQQRIKAFDIVFPDALSLMANSLRSGFSVERCIQLLSTEMPSPLKDEFALIHREMQLGQSLKQALVHLEKRIPLPYVRLFVTAMIIQQEVGGSLADIISSLADTVRKGREIKQEIKVMTSQGRASAVLVGLLPFAIVALLWFANPVYLMPLFQTNAGHIILGLALLMEFLGFIVIMKMVSFKME